MAHKAGLLETSLGFKTRQFLQERSVREKCHLGTKVQQMHRKRFIFIMAFQSEEIFLDMFEDEYRAACRQPPKIELVISDASLLLPPTATPLTGIDFTKRLPCGEVERARRSIRTFFRLRQLSLDIQGRLETK